MIKIKVQLFGGRGVGSGRYTKYKYNYLPKDPNDLIRNGWEDVTDPRNKSNTRHFYNPKTKDRATFDKGEKGESGNKGRDHYHWRNPNSKNRHDYYLDKNGNPVRKGHKDSHLYP